MSKLIDQKPLLDWPGISGYLTPAQRETIRLYHLVDVIDSTSNWALKQFDSPENIPSVCFAEQQTRGRGRQGRSWYSPRSRNIYMSLAWSFDLSVQELVGLGLAAGIAIARVLEGLSLQPRLKWPNDVWVDGKKIAGVLIESRVKNTSQVNAVIGIGLNFHMQNIGQAEIDQPWTDIVSQMAGDKQISRNQLSGLLLGSVVDVCRQYQASGLALFLKEWERFDVCQGAELALHTEQGEMQGTGMGIDETGGLKVLSEGEIKIFQVADVSVRMKTPC